MPETASSPGPTPLITPNDSSIVVRTFTQRRNKVPIGYNGTRQIDPPNCPFPFDDHHQNLIHPYRAQPHSPPQTASGSDQPCCHCSHVRTDVWDKRNFSRMSAPLYKERRANNTRVLLSSRFGAVYRLQSPHIFYVHRCSDTCRDTGDLHGPYARALNASPVSTACLSTSQVLKVYHYRHATKIYGPCAKVVYTVLLSIEKCGPQSSGG